jgi:hypothetical protein
MRINTVPHATPQCCPQTQAESSGGSIGAVAGGSPFPGWEAFVAHTVHPVKVAIVEALLWIGEPLSATQMEGSFDESGHYLGIVSYHAKGLEEWGALVVADTRQVRGAVESFFYFPELG